MKSFRRYSVSVNTGSMADIAFLLLIFFLVTTTIASDKGILRKLPLICESIDCIKDIHENNLLRIVLNDKQEIMIKDKLVNINEVQNLVQAFVDNNGFDKCDYCKGEQSIESSDHPKNAIISLNHDALTKYEFFINVQDEIAKAYYQLRANYAKEAFNKTPEQLTKVELEIIKKAYPFIVSEFMVKRAN